MIDLTLFIERCRQILPTTANDHLIETLVSFKCGRISEAYADLTILLILDKHASLLNEYNEIMEGSRPFSSVIATKAPDVLRDAKKQKCNVDPSDDDENAHAVDFISNLLGDGNVGE